ncbi:NADH dehydrogenase [archaeon HR01]|nr:NADH dehydrogenase [archaeon HR01]
MSALDAIFKRVTVRHYEDKPVEFSKLVTLARAAQKAPTGGNTPYRRVMIIDDPDTIAMIKKIAPGYLSNAPAAILIYTDLEVAEKGLGRLGRDVCSLIDSGAAAANISIAAIELGLATCFTKSYSEVGMKKVLDIPDNCRTDLLVQVGYPHPGRPRSIKKKPEGNIIYHNRHGVSIND